MIMPTVVCRDLDVNFFYYVKKYTGNKIHVGLILLIITKYLQYHYKVLIHTLKLLKQGTLIVFIIHIEAIIVL